MAKKSTTPAKKSVKKKKVTLTIRAHTPEKEKMLVNLQKHTMESTATGALWTAAERYLSLADENVKLHNENARLKDKLSKSKSIIENFSESLKEISTYKF